MSEQEKTKSTKDTTAKKPISRGRGNGNTGGEIIMTQMSGKSSSIPTPEEKVDTSKKILKWGKDNTYPYYLNYLYHNSAMHAGIINGKVYFCVSGGLDYEGPDQAVWEEFYNNNKKSLDDKNLDELQWDYSRDYEKSNSFVYKVKINSLDGKVRKVDFVPFEKWRFQMEKDDEGNDVWTGNLEVSDDWKDSKEDPKILEPYDPKRQDPNSEDRQRMFYVMHMEKGGQALDEPDSKKVNPGFYPTPPYAGAITSIDTLIQINKYNNSEVYNGFSLGTVLNLNNGSPKNEEKRKELKKKIQDEATGAYNAGSVMILMNNGKDKEASVLNLNGNNLPDRYTNTKKSAEESIIHAHSVTSPILFGVKQEGSLGNATELQTAYMIMQSNYFAVRRAALLSVLNWIGKNIVKLQGEIKFNDPEIRFEPNIAEGTEVASALNDMSPLLAGQVINRMTPNEIRALAKLPAIEGGDVLPGAAPVSEEVVVDAEGQDRLVELLSKVGRPKSEIQELFSRSYTEYGMDTDEEVLQIFAKETFQNLTDLQMQTLGLINEGQDFNTIRKALDIDGTELANIYRRLSNLEMISSDGAILSAGASELAASDLDQLEVLFEYRLRPDAPDLLPGGKSRDFCQQLIALNRVYTRDEIDQISAMEGYDVFRYRGGWYHNPDQDRNEPGCRHEWAQIVTFV